MSDEDLSVIWRGFEARLERLEDLVRELDSVVRGSRRNKDPGIVAEQDRMDELLIRLNAVIFQDSTGKHGLAHDVEVLMGRQVGEDRRSEFRWKYWAPTFLAILSLTVTALMNLDKIKANLPKYHPGPLEAKIDRAKRPRGKKIIKIRIVPPPTLPPENPPSEPLKESQPKN